MASETQIPVGKTEDLSEEVADIQQGEEPGARSYNNYLSVIDFLAYFYQKITRIVASSCTFWSPNLT